MTDNGSVLTTPLHALHLELGGKMVPFAGYEMPVNFSDGIIKEHLHTRSEAGLFDVSHMGQIRVQGNQIAEKLESILPVDLLSLPPYRQKYALFLNQNGGVLDDLMVINLGEEFMLVVNAACKHDDLTYLQSQLGADLAFTLLHDRALIALQGPKAATVLQQELAEEFDLSSMKFMHAAELSLNGHDCIVTRSGYTGEDGFEISIGEKYAESFCRQLLTYVEVKSVGLGARDSLRLEAGLCLYGQDLTPEHTPIEANIGWAISPARRESGKRPGGFPGANQIFEQQESGVARSLVALLPEGRAPVRAGTKLFDLDQNFAGTVTSGGFSPTLGNPISLGYVSSELSHEGTALLAEVRGKQLPLNIVSLPFVKHRYHR
ncbi:MAG: glycine cleavage system aminomethyltransferase GcvT [Granulosicoccus sp.]|nr:glycine cleavage system aminomethyltransferase GcvT [Granulosicoccus sp.]